MGWIKKLKPARQSRLCPLRRHFHSKARWDMPQNLKKKNINPPPLYLIKLNLIWALLWLSFNTFSFLFVLQEKQPKKSLDSQNFTFSNTEENWDEKKSRNRSSHLKYIAVKVACVAILQPLVCLFLVYCLVFTVTSCTLHISLPQLSKTRRGGIRHWEYTHFCKHFNLSKISVC